MMIYYYNYQSLTERFNLEYDILERLVDIGVLRPERWDDKKYRDLVLNSKEKGLAECRWHIEEVEKYQKLITLISANQHHFYHVLNTRLNEIRNAFIDRFDKADGKLNHLVNSLASLKVKFERKELMIDSGYFCEKTGYTRHYFRKKVKYIDPEHNAMRLAIGFYKKLIWHKVGGRWMTPLLDFEELRANFSYEVLITDQKRRGVFIPRIPKFNQEEFLRMIKKINLK